MLLSLDISPALFYAAELRFIHFNAALWYYFKHKIIDHDMTLDTM